jgi:hypothetical protein
MPNLQPLPVEVLDYHLDLQGEIAAVMTQLFYYDAEVRISHISRGQVVRSHMSERWDAPVDENSETGLALRIQSIPAIEITDGMLPKAAHPNYRVLMLEYGTCDADEQRDRELNDEDDQDLFKWSPYVLALIDVDDLSDCAIVNALTGAELDDDDLVSVRVLLSQWSASRLEQQYEEVLVDELAADTQVIATSSFVIRKMPKVMTRDDAMVEKQFLPN